LTNQRLNLNPIPVIKKKKKKEKKKKIKIGGCTIRKGNINSRICCNTRLGEHEKATDMDAQW
jgi:hypothetical protein